ncbi:hypothetical protein TELCIR_06117 [Teladorsagia circumcincta]|uniref:Myosin motor domain-containing protein n=1 Tax=Teladorsagia circumcincta TaxID=45464 RepID=A0A2G9UP27_TELCI|nr:hypothetical protein TELCIR_06117 [Teladorsagia circumcincta]
MNSFEQLCINYTNEKLQQLFNNTMFEKEQQEYLNEGLEWDMIDFGLNLKPTIDLIEKPMGILSTLDDICLFPQGNDSGFVERLAAQHHNHSKYLVPEMRSKSDFAIVHYAGRVDYQAQVSDMCCMAATEVGEAAAVFGGRVKKGMFRTEFRQRYERLLAPNAIPHGFMDGKEAVRRILEAIDVQPSLYRIGQSKVFFRTGVIAGLEEDRDERLAVLVVRFQALCRGMLARADFNRRREKAAAIRIIQRNEKKSAIMCHRNNLFKVKPLLEITNKDMVIAEKEQELKTTSEKLRRSEIFISDMYRKIEKYDEEKNRLQEKLDLESMERAEVDEERQRIAARKVDDCLLILDYLIWKSRRRVQMELETALDHMEKQLHAEEQRREAAERERKKLMDNVHDLEHHLEEEERARQILHLEKVEIEKKFRDLESQNLEFNDTAGRLGKEKRMLEEKVKDLSARLIDEEERAKSLLKQKNKAEISAVDLQEELEREKLARNEAESARRALDGELREEKEAATERLRKIEEFAQIISRKDAELVQLKLRNDEETASRQQLERNLRELQSQLDDAVEDLRQEQALRVKSEKARRELSEQVETYKLELEETQDKSASHHAMRTKREEEYSLLQNQLAESIRESDQRYEALRSKHLKQLEELGEEMDQLKRAKAAMAESQLADQALRLQQYAEENEQLVSKVTKAAEETARNRSNLSVKLRKAEDEAAELRDAQDELKQLLEKSEKARDAETRYLNAVKELKDLQGQVDTIEKERRMLRLEVDNLASTKDDAGKSVFELEKARKRLEEELAEAREQIAELEDALQMADDAKTRSDVMHQAAKQEWERQLSQRNDEEEDQRRSLTKRLRELEEELNAEQRFKAQAAASKKKLEAQVVTLQEEIEHLTKQNEEASRQIRRVQLSAKEAETEGAEARAAMDEALCKARDAEKRKAEDEAAELRDAQDELKQLLEKSEKEVASLKSQLLDSRKRFDEELSDAVGEVQRKLSREQVAMENKVNEAEAARDKAERAKVKAQQEARDAETRYLNAVKELKDLQGQVDTIEKERRMLRLEVDNLASTKDDAGKSVFELEKARKRLEEELAEAREQIAELEDALQMADDAKTRSDVMHQAAKQEWERQLSQRNDEEEDQRRSLTKRVEQLTSELTMERSMCERADADKVTLERTVRELKSQLQEAESAAATRVRSQLATAEARAQMLEQQLQAEEQEKARVCRQARRLETRIMEMNVQFEEERRQIEQHRESCERANSRYKAERRRAQELEEEVATANSKYREISRQLMDMNDANDSLTREVNALRARVAIAGDRRLLSAPRDLKRFGSNNSITKGEEYVTLGTRSINSVGGSDNMETRPSSRNTPAGSNNDPSEDDESLRT